MSSFTRVAALADISEVERCTYTGVAESYEPDNRCRQMAFHLFPQSHHCGQHMTDEEVATVLPRIRAWKLGLEDLYLQVSTMTAVGVAEIRVHVIVEEAL